MILVLFHWPIGTIANLIGEVSLLPLVTFCGLTMVDTAKASVRAARTLMYQNFLQWVKQRNEVNGYDLYVSTNSNLPPYFIATHTFFLQMNADKSTKATSLAKVNAKRDRSAIDAFYMSFKDTEQTFGVRFSFSAKKQAMLDATHYCRTSDTERERLKAIAKVAYCCMLLLVFVLFNHP